MNKKEIVERISEKTGFTKKDCALMLDVFLETTTQELKTGGKIKLVGFGTFETVKRKARTGRNPHNPTETIKIPATITPRFKPGTALKASVKEK